MIGRIDPLSRNFERIETVWFDLYHDTGDTRITLTGEVTVFRDRRDDQGVVIVRLDEPNRLWMFHVLPDWTNYPMAVENIKRSIGRESTMVAYDYEAESSLSPSI
jgi:hypothetical protein